MDLALQARAELLPARQQRVGDVEGLPKGGGGVVDRAGEHGLEPLFTDPTAVPTPNEIEAPGLWLARVAETDLG